MSKGVILAGLLLLAVIAAGCSKEGEFKEITRPVLSVNKYYSSGINVASKDDAIMAFNEFVEWSKNNRNSTLLGIADTVESIIVEDAEPYGIYKGTKYWVVAYSYYDKSAQQTGRSQVQISENGDIVIFLSGA